MNLAAANQRAEMNTPIKHSIYITVVYYMSQHITNLLFCYKGQPGISYSLLQDLARVARRTPELAKYSRYHVYSEIHTYIS